MPSNSSRPASHIKENVPPFKPSIAERVKARARSKRPLESLNEEKFTVKVGDLGKTPEEQERLEAEEEEERRRAEEETAATASKRRKVCTGSVSPLRLFTCTEPHRLISSDQPSG